MAQGGSADLSGILLDLGLAADLTGIQSAGSVLTVSLNVLAIVPLVAQRFSLLGVGHIAAGALVSIHAALGAGSGLVALDSGIQDHVMAQSLAALNDGNLTRCAADGAELADLGGLGAGCIGVGIFVGVFAGSSDHFGLGLAADRAQVLDLASLSAGSVGAVDLFPDMVGRNGLVAQAGAADGADVLGNAGFLAGGLLQDIANNFLMGVYYGIGVGIHIAVAAGGAGMGGEALVGAVRLGHNSFIAVAQRGNCQLTLELVDLHCIADGADVLCASTEFAGCVNDLSVAPGVAQSIGILALGVLAAGALVGVHAALGAGCCDIARQGLVQNQRMAQRLADFRAAYFCATVSTADNNNVGLCTGRIQNGLSSILMQALCFRRESRSRQHGEDHHERHKRC